MVATRRVATQERGRETQQRVIEGAAVAFGAAGYSSTTVRHISDASGVSVGAMNFHFQSKEQVALAVIEEQHRRAIALAEEVSAQHDTVIEILIYLTRAVAYQLMTDQVVAAGVELSMEVGDFVDPTIKSYDGWTATIKTQLVRGLESGELVSDVGTDKVAEIFIACFTGVQVVSRVRTGRKDFLENLHELWLLILKGLVTPEHETFARKVLAEAFSKDSLRKLQGHI